MCGATSVWSIQSFNETKDPPTAKREDVCAALAAARVGLSASGAFFHNLQHFVRLCTHGDGRRVQVRGAAGGAEGDSLRLSPSQALRHAQDWLKSLSADDIRGQLRELLPADFAVRRCWLPRGGTEDGEEGVWYARHASAVDLSKCVWVGLSAGGGDYRQTTGQMKRRLRLSWLLL